MFEDTAKLKTDPEMVKLATQLIERQTARYDPSDIEDRYETRLRAMLDAKLKGEGLDAAVDEPADRGNVIDLMAALKKSLGETTAEEKPAPAPKRLAKAPAKKPVAQAAAKPPRKRA